MTLSTHTLADVLEFLRTGERSCVVTSHARPDGDAVGSVLAMGFVLDQMGLAPEMVLADPVPSVYRSLPGADRIRHARSIAGGTGPVIVMECDSTSRTGLTGLDGRVILNIDHHASGRPFGTLNWIDPAACAVGAMVYELATAARIEITPELAICLYAAILSDTAAFTNSGTSASTLELAATLARHGADPAALAREIFATSESKLRLLGTALGKMSRVNRIAWTSVTLDEMTHVGADAEDCEGIVNYLIGIPGVQAAVFLRELPGNAQFRLSLRSKGTVDVSRVAERMGGGGHRAASGCTLDGPLARATERIVTSLEAEL